MMGEPTVKLDARGQVVRIQLDEQVWSTCSPAALRAAADMLKLAADRDTTVADLRDAERRLVESGDLDSETEPPLGFRAWPVLGGRVEVQIGPDLPVMIRQDTATEWAAEMAEAADELTEVIAGNSALI